MTKMFFRKVLTTAALLVLGLIAESTAVNYTYEIAIRRVPSYGSWTQTVIGIPRQQALCLSTDGYLVAFNRGQYLYLTHDRGATWIDTLDVSTEGYFHEHFAVKDDTVYKFSPSLNNPSLARVMLISTDQNQLTTRLTTGVNFPGYSSSGDGIITSGASSGVGRNGMVMLLRSGSSQRVGHYTFSSDRGHTWQPFSGDSVGAYYGGADRIGLVTEGDSCMAVIYQGGNVDIWHFRPSSLSWSREGSGHFISGSNQRAFSAAVCRDTVWASITNMNVSCVLVNRRRVGVGSIVQDTLWKGPAAYVSNPEYIGYTALQTVQSLNTVVCWYVHPDNGTAGPASSKLYLRVWQGGGWSNEQLVCNVGGSANLTAPFVVPGSHGNYAYCEFMNSDGMNLAVVKINGGITRNDIDRAIRDFKDGKKSLQEVLNLVDQYNSQG